MNRENWEVKKFEDCINKILYTNKIQKTDFLKNGVYPIISQEEGFINGYWDNEFDVFKVMKPVVVFGDHTRVLKYIDFDFVLGADGVKILEPADGIKGKFFFYFLRWFNVPNLGYSRHYKLLKELSIPIPPLPIQEAIVKELDTLHRLKELQEQQLTEYDNLAQSTFYSMFGDPIENDRGWEVDCLENVCIRKGEYGAGSSAIPFDETKPRYIRITDINESGALNVEKVSPSNKLDFEKYQLLDGDILFARSGATVGKTYLHSSENGNCIFAGYLIRFIVDRKKIIPRFLFQYTKTDFYKDWIASRQRVVAQPNINAKQYGELSVFIPPLPLQSQFADHIEKIEKQKELVKQSIAQTQMLIDYTMDKYFN